MNSLASRNIPKSLPGAKSAWTISTIILRAKCSREFSATKWNSPLGRKLPIIIHCRDAWDDCLAQLEQHWKAHRPRRHPALFHQHARRCRARPRNGLPGFVCREFDLSENAEHSRRCQRACRSTNILIETDSPYLAPQAYRGKRNEPAYVAEVAKTLATVRNLAARRNRRCHRREFPAILPPRPADVA